jgi:hypothetical protein
MIEIITQCKFTRASQVPGMRAQTFHARTIMGVTICFKVNVCARIVWTWLARANLHRVNSVLILTALAQYGPSKLTGMNLFNVEQ